MADGSGIQTLALRLFQVSQPLWEAAAQAVHVIVLTDVLHGVASMVETKSCSICGMPTPFFKGCFFM